MAIFVNQVGYKKEALKHATVSAGNSDAESVKYTLFKKTEAGDLSVLEGIVSGVDFEFDDNSGEMCALIDFSDVREDGSYYFVSGGEQSATFSISNTVYDGTFFDSMKMFYYQRCGIELEEKYAGKFTHKACHTGNVYELRNPENRFECCGGWHDAGDYGRYVTAAAVALGHLLYAYRLRPENFKIDLNIPESGNGVPDILNECRFELEWMLKMQREDGGVYHKCTSISHTGFMMPEDDPLEFLVTPVSSMAVADFAAICALASQVYAEYDNAFAARLKAAAIKSYEWLIENPGFLYDNPSECTTGEYDDLCDVDERLWASVELYKITGDSKYLKKLGRIMEMNMSTTALGWGEVGGFAAICVLTAEEGVFDPFVVDTMRGRWIDEADRLMSIIVSNSYELAMRPYDFGWGSNMIVLTRCDVLCFAYELTGDEEYLEGAYAQLDYILGRNAVDTSYVTGNGERAYSHPHNRPSESDGIDEAIRGQVSGGPNHAPCDEPAIELIPRGTAPMKCYIDHWGSYSTNEITIYWNSPLVFALAFLK